MAATILTLNDCTEYRETVAARPPRIAHLGVILCVTTLTVCLTWAALTPVDLVVRADVARQSWLLRVSIAKLQPIESALVREQLTHCAMLDYQSTSSQAADIGEQLSSLAWQNEHEAGWLGIQWRGRGWFVDAVGLEAGGLIEIASFLTSLDQVARSSRYVSLVTKTLHAINSILNEGKLEDEEGFYARIAALVASLGGHGNETTTTEVARLKRRLAEIDETRAGLPSVNSAAV